jgi:hypothetical protein
MILALAFAVLCADSHQGVDWKSSDLASWLNQVVSVDRDVFGTDDPVLLEQVRRELGQAGAHAPLRSISPLATGISSWAKLKSSIGAASGRNISLTLSTPFDMEGFSCFQAQCGCISIQAPHTAVTINGNGAVLDGKFHDRFFYSSSILLAISNITLQNGQPAGGPPAGGAISIDGGTLILTSCTFSGNQAPKNFGGAIDFGGAAGILKNCVFSMNTAGEPGGAISVANGGGTNTIAITLINCTFSGNKGLPTAGAGGALWLDDYSVVLIQGCTFIGDIYQAHNDISRRDPAGSNVTFACVEGFIGSPVQMQGIELTVIPPKTLHCTAAKYLCNTITHTCVQAPTGSTLKECTADCSCVVPLNCGIHNDTTVCSHVFKGCDVCPTCCQKYILNDKDCTSCVETECKNGHHECCR